MLSRPTGLPRAWRTTFDRPTRCPGYRRLRGLEAERRGADRHPRHAGRRAQGRNRQSSYRLPTHQPVQRLTAVYARLPSGSHIRDRVSCGWPAPFRIESPLCRLKCPPCCTRGHFARYRGYRACTLRDRTLPLVSTDLGDRCDMNVYRILGDYVGTSEARVLAEQLVAWHDSMVKHLRIV